MTAKTSYTSLFGIPDKFQDKYRPLANDTMEGVIDLDICSCFPAHVRDNPLKALSLSQSQTVRDARNVTSRVRIKNNSSEYDVWVKEFRPRSVTEWLQYAFRPGKAVQAWNAALGLNVRGIGTPRPLIGLRKRGRTGGAQGLLVVEHIPNSEELRELLRADRLSPERRCELIEALARFLSKFHNSGFRHRDLRRGNVLVRESPVKEFEFYLIDLNRLRRYTRLTTPQRLRELERLSLDDDDIPAFFCAYTFSGVDSRSAENLYRKNLARLKRIDGLPKPMNRLTRKIWYYFQELRLYGLSQKELLPR
jgi:serine/threonine protein kinase